MAILLDNTNDYVSYGTPSWVGGLTAISVAFTVNFSSLVASRILTKWDGTANSAMLFGLGLPGTVEFFGAVGTSSNYNSKYTNSVDIQLNTEYRVVYTWSTPGNWNIYVNGVDEALTTDQSGTPTLSATSVPLQFGAGADAGTSPLTGREVAIWNRKLSAGEALAVSNGFSPRMFPRGLKLYDTLLNTSSRDTFGGIVPTHSSTASAAHGRVIYPSGQIIQFPSAAAGGGPTYTMVMGEASFALSPQAISMLAGRSVTIDAASYSMSPQDINMSLAATFLVEGASYTMSAQDVGLFAGRLFTVGEASYTMSPQDISIAASRLLAMDVSSYTLGAQDMSMLVSRLLTVGHATFTMSPQDITMDLGTAYTFTMGEASYTLTPQGVNMLASRLLEMGSVQFTLDVQELRYTVAIVNEASARYTIVVLDAKKTIVIPDSIHTITV